MIWWHRLIYGHRITWTPWGLTLNEAICSCGKRWVK